jgi:hypothetical protein
VARELLALVKHDCPVCDQVLPALDAAGVRIVSQSSAQDTAAQAQRVGLGRVPELDADLELSARLDPAAVPAVFAFEDGIERERVEGLQRDRLAALTGAALDGLPELRPGCASRTRDPDVAPALAARRARAEGRIVSRELELGDLEDEFEALHARGVTDGLPVVPPTPERVVALLEHTSRHPQDLVGIVPPYGGRATVEKVAINAVMAGCAGPELPIVLAAVEAACREPFALHGLVATTSPPGPVVVVSGQYAFTAGMNAEGNVLGQGNRANSTVGRALQLAVRNIGGGIPRREDRAAHGNPGKVGMAFAERLDQQAPWPGLAQDMGVPASETGVVVFAGEAPHWIVDQTSRTPEDVVASLARGAAHVAFDALLIVGPEHGRVFRAAGWSRARMHAELDERTSRKQILLAYAGGDAGLFSMVFGSWVSGPMGSEPQVASVEPWR